MILVKRKCVIITAMVSWCNRMNWGNYMEWAGVGIIVGVQVATFLYTLRRMDAMQKEISEARQEFLREMGELRKEIGKVAERVARLEGIIIGRQEVGNGAVTQTGDD